MNRAFHLALVQPGGQRLTTNIVSRLHVLADRYVRKHLEPKGRVLRAEAEHHEMLEAWIKRRDARVRKLITEHLEHTLAICAVPCVQRASGGQRCCARSGRDAGARKNLSPRRRKTTDEKSGIQSC